MKNNPGFDPAEIEQLKKECLDEGQSYVLVEDDMELEDSGEFVQFQFVGKYEDQEVIFDVILTTTRLQHASLLLEEAEKRVKRKFKDFVPLENRAPGYKVNEAADEMVLEVMEELEEAEEITVAEFITIDTEHVYGIGVEVALDVEEIDGKTIERFIKDFKAGTLSLDNTQKSFKSQEEE